MRCHQYRLYDSPDANFSQEYRTTAVRGKTSLVLKEDSCAFHDAWLSQCHLVNLVFNTACHRSHDASDTHTHTYTQSVLNVTTPNTMKLCRQSTPLKSERLTHVIYDCLTTQSHSFILLFSQE